MFPFLEAFIAGGFFLLAFVLWLNPKQVNFNGNRWLSAFLTALTFRLFQKNGLLPGLSFSVSYAN